MRKQNPHKNRVEEFSNSGEYISTDRFDDPDVSMYLMLADSGINAERLVAEFSGNEPFYLIKSLNSNFACRTKFFLFFFRRTTVKTPDLYFASHNSEYSAVFIWIKKARSGIHNLYRFYGYCLLAQRMAYNRCFTD